MKRLTLLLSLCLSLFLVAGCGSDETSETKMPDEVPAVSEAVGSPFSQAEFDKFVNDIPEITRITNPSLNAGTEVSPEEITKLVHEAAASLGWEGQRFMYVYSQAMSVLSLEQLGKMEAQLKAQMKEMPEEQQQAMQDMMNQQMGVQRDKLQKYVDEKVAPSELEIIRANLDKLYAALGIKQQ